jgi:protein gp37
VTGEEEAWRKIANNKTTIVRTHDGQQTEYPLPKGPAKFNQTNDQVSWAAFTWNPVTGCLHNCKYCYAREGAVMNENLKKYYPFGFTPTFWEHRLDAPAHMSVPEEARSDARFGRVFVSSMGDLFGKWTDDKWIEKVFASCRRNPEWEYLFLTKFPQRYVGLELPPTAWIGTTVDEQYRVKSPRMHSARSVACASSGFR